MPRFHREGTIEPNRFAPIALSRGACVALLLILFALSPRPAKAMPGTTITVNDWGDTSGNGSICTLRDAINAANSNAAAGGCLAGSAYPTVDTISITQSRFACLINPALCVITLSSPLPQVVEPVIIYGGTGPSTWRPVISGANLYRVFDLGGVDVTIQNINIIRGNASATCPGCYGGAINTSSLGTVLTVANVYFSENHASVRGGAIYVVNGATVVVDSSTFISNTTGSYGGAIDQVGGVLILTNSTLSGNSAVDGGGLEVQSASDTRLTNVTISGNRATGRGGGISRIGTSYSMNLNNVTISNNTADSDNNGSGDGGGIYRGGGTVISANTIFAGNFDTPNNAGTGTIHPDCSWPVNDAGIASFGYNLLGIDAGCKGLVNGVGGDIVGTLASPVNALLGPLASNGGATQTRALLPGSRAIDAGDPDTPGVIGNCAAADQRGVARPVGLRCDIGAFEAPVYVKMFLPLIRR